MGGSAPHDPMEKLIADRLDTAGIGYLRENDPRNLARLDFYLPDYDLYIGIKRMASDRSGDQLKRADNVALVQGTVAVEWLVKRLEVASLGVK
ncbi:MAG: hypothetical protein ACKOPE_04905 [Novosphingobium sp.]